MAQPTLHPDTLDLVDRAELALNGLGGTLDPERDWEMYFFIRYGARRPYMVHWGFDPSNEPKFAESFPLMRLMTGTDTQQAAEDGLLDALLRRIDPVDGLLWNRAGPGRPWHTGGHAGYELRQEDYANVYAVGRMIRAMLVRWELTGAAAWEGRIAAMVRGLDRLAIRRDDYAYYPDGGFGEAFSFPRSGWIHTNEPRGEVEGGEGAVTAYHGHQLNAVSRWYALTGDPAALDLVTRLARFVMKPKFWGGVPSAGEPAPGTPPHVCAPGPEGACIAGHEQGHWFSHFHSRAVALRGLLEYAKVAGDLRALEFVRQAWEYTWTVGIPRLGWVDCWPASANSNHRCEGCALGDLTALGIRLSDAGAGDQWDFVDAIVRNQLVEGQLVRADLLEAVAAASPGDLAEGHPVLQHDFPGQLTRDRVIERSLGNFAGFSAPNRIPDPWVMQCCTGNGTQGLYYAWEGIVRTSGDAAQVNLLLNRVSEKLDIESWLPHAGRVVLRNKGLRRLSIRVPGWVARRELEVTADGRPLPFTWAGNFVVADPGPRAEVCLRFPVPTSSARYTAGRGTREEVTYTCTFRGSTAVDVSPHDTGARNYPLYQRAHLATGDAPMRELTRTVPTKTVLRW
jgi:hypothetical protein